MGSKVVPSLWQGAALLYAAVVVVLSLLPSELLVTWVPPAREGALGGAGDAVAKIAAVAGLVLLLVAVGSGALKLRIPVGPRLRLSRPLSLALLVYVVCLALIVSAGLRELVWGLATDLVPTWLDLAIRRVSPGHIMAYAGLAFLLVLAWGHRLDLRLLGLLAFALSGAVELLQDMVPGRNAHWWDLLSNGLGVLIGLIAGWLAAPWLGTRHGPTAARHPARKGSGSYPSRHRRRSASARRSPVRW